ncbi:Transglutaminase-like superfamily protein [Micromonospora haikouensis]|uniref:Transglutaminase-like superfamily protein n=1 Tax=Micromonospora haikouensis TaxID=686309 RepID=A0A1C4YFU2_9ACTN|nr:lasso peptide biosynthesis B2 protein [Micromonospora haikouensis]SCF19583.1 Transglutaminase-like superfamily protein [Micromonospora haikouensis]
MPDPVRALPALARVARRHGPAGVALVAWTVLAYRRVRRQLARGGLDAVCLPAPPPGGTDALVRRALRRADGNCLESALVLQRWYARGRVCRTVVIGVSAPGDDFHAHAWLDGDDDPHRHELAELLRRPAPAAWLP